MGLIQKIKELFSAKRLIEAAMEQLDRENQRYAAMTAEELASLSDEDLVSAALYRTDLKLDALIGEELKTEETAEWVTLLPKLYRPLYILTEFEGEIMNGGLSQFFANSSGALTPLVSDALLEVGAAQHHALFSGFLIENGVDVTAPEDFETDENENLLEAFDERYYAMPPLEQTLAAYLRANVSEI